MNLLSRIIQNISRRKNEEEDDLDEMEKSTHHTSKSNLHLKNDQIIRFWQRKCFPELSTYYCVPNFRRCQKMLYVLFIKACWESFFSFFLFFNLLILLYLLLWAKFSVTLETPFDKLQSYYFPKHLSNLFWTIKYGIWGQSKREKGAHSKGNRSSTQKRSYKLICTFLVNCIDIVIGLISLDDDRDDMKRFPQIDM